MAKWRVAVHTAQPFMRSSQSPLELRRSSLKSLVFFKHLLFLSKSVHHRPPAFANVSPQGIPFFNTRGNCACSLNVSCFHHFQSACLNSELFGGSQKSSNLETFLRERGRLFAVKYQGRRDSLKHPSLILGNSICVAFHPSFSSCGAWAGMAPALLGNVMAGESSFVKAAKVRPLQSRYTNSWKSVPLAACSAKSPENPSKAVDVQKAHVEASEPGAECRPAGRGALIVLEGLDRSGKTTQCEQLAQFLKSQGHPVCHLRFPDRSTETGKKLSAYLKNAAEIDDETVHRLFFDNRLEKLEEMENALAAGITLVVDRYSYSGAAFSSAKGLDMNWCKRIEQRLPAPDVVFFLDLPAEVAAARGGYGEERYEKQDFQRAVAAQFAKLRDSNWQTIDASKSWEEVQLDLQRRAEAAVNRCRSQGPPLKRMWVDES